ncbi:ABC transporter permease [Sinanaerobacter sp. ZZT-01]|uniref:ABC transporter permease n=1 Tax=Sinanaerobacter sp. ZZT-01 TaxID=3111540 RepID=UPI002D7A3954|nr:ABC transporter permease [Sinanaerobacter sp. ZZT-01]WRR92560.1 ABC transporter permease [Sinanaerobacter sp. ZZT-01]
MGVLSLIVQQTMLFSIPLLIVALGAVFTERGGVTNIALEGMMIMGAFTSIFFINQMQDKMSGQTLLLIAMLIATVTGAIFSLLHAYASINLKSDQIISGTALNLFAPAFAIYVARMIQDNGVQQIGFTNTFRIKSVPILGEIPFIGNLFFKNAYITTYIGLGILVLSVVIIYKTKFGLRLRACGEHPHAADSVGINVYKMRYAGVVISGALAGLGGLIFVVPTSTNFNASVAGYGFLALAVMIFGQWKPIRVFFAAIFFGLMKTIASAYSVIPLLSTANIPSDVYKMIPFIATLIVLAFSSKSSEAPKAVATPYDKGSR